MNFNILEPKSTESGRFVQISRQDVDEFLDEQENRNTKKKTEIDINVFTHFLKSIGEVRKPEDIPAEELGEHLSSFIMSVRKRNGGEYEPSTLRAYVSSVDRYMKKKNTGINIMTDAGFDRVRKTLKAKQKHLKSLGKGNKPFAADPLTTTHISEMYTAQNLGCSNPTALQNSMWLTCTVHFGMRTGTETHNLRWGDIQLSEENGTEFIVYTQERQTKTRTGENPRDVRAVKPRAYATDDSEEDPVVQYKLFSDMRPNGFSEPDSPFFLAINSNYVKGPWYKKSPLGINSMYKIMKIMTKGTSINKENSRITPYSARKHLVQTLSDGGLPANQIIQVSGHRNVNSINNYSKLNQEQQKNISHLLSNKSATVTSGALALPQPPERSPVTSQVMSFTSERKSHQMTAVPAITSMFSGNNIYGNIIISPDMFKPPATGITASETVSHQSAVRLALGSTASESSLTDNDMAQDIA